MRTVTFQSVFNAILRRHGLDPLGDAVNQDTARTITGHINRRVNTVWQMWDWPQLGRTEERAFRSVWNDTREFKRVGENGYPDEFYYLGSDSDGTDSGYYVLSGSALTDPPAGTLPTNTSFFSTLDTVNPYIDFDQTCRRSIGFVYGVYPKNPSLEDQYCLNNFGRKFTASEKGIRVFDTAQSTVFVWYSLPVSQFTMVPYIAGKTYSRGERVFYSTTGECYRALAQSTSVVPTDADFWAVEPLPDVFAYYVEAGAYADGLNESWATGDEKTRLIKSQKAEAEADGQIQGEIDLLLSQGQKHYYGSRRNWWTHHVRVSEPWGGDIVHLLTDVCEDDAEFVSPETVHAVGWIYGDNIVALRAVEAAPSLDQVDTVGRELKTIIKIVIDPGTGFENQEYRLMAGAADSNDPGQIAPLDYALATNNKHWERID